MKATPSVNSARVLFALLLVHTIGPQTIIVLPALTQGYVEYRGATESFAGFAASVEAWGISIAALCMMVLISRVRWRLLMGGALLAMASSNLLSLLGLGDTLLLVCRFVAGFGGGVIVAVSYAMIGQTERTQRNFGLAIALVLIYGAIAFPLLPKLYQLAGIEGGFMFFAAFAVVGLPFVSILPDHGHEESDSGAEARSAERIEAVLASSCMLFYFVGLMGAWSYFYRFGVRAGLSESSVGFVLSMSQFAGIAGAFAVVVLERWLRPAVGAPIGILFCAVAIAALAVPHSFATFLALSFAFQFAWNLTHPLLLSLLSLFDPSGRIIAYGTGMQFLGMALGPSLAALLVSEESLGPVAIAGAICTAFSVVAVLAAVRFFRSQHAELA